MSLRTVRRRTPLLAVLAVLMSFLAAPPARACSCFLGDPRDALANADGAFVGTLTAVTVASDGTSYADYAFEVENWSALERYCDHLAHLGRTLVWGVGRHGPGRNLYAYAPDPENVIVEAFADLLHVQNEATYVPIDWSDLGDRALNLWGPPPPPDWPDRPRIATSSNPESARSWRRIASPAIPGRSWADSRWPRERR